MPPHKSSPILGLCLLSFVPGRALRAVNAVGYAPCSGSPCTACSVLGDPMQDMLLRWRPHARHAPCLEVPCKACFMVGDPIQGIGHMQGMVIALEIPCRTCSLLWRSHARHAPCLEGPCKVSFMLGDHMQGMLVPLEALCAVWPSMFLHGLCLRRDFCVHGTLGVWVHVLSTPGWLSMLPFEGRRVVQSHSAKDATQTLHAVICFSGQQSFFQSFMGFDICSTHLCNV